MIAQTLLFAIFVAVGLVSSLAWLPKSGYRVRARVRYYAIRVGVFSILLSAVYALLWHSRVAVALAGFGAALLVCVIYMLTSMILARASTGIAGRLDARAKISLIAGAGVVVLFTTIILGYLGLMRYNIVWPVIFAALACTVVSAVLTKGADIAGDTGSRVAELVDLAGDSFGDGANAILRLLVVVSAVFTFVPSTTMMVLTVAMMVALVALVMTRVFRYSFSTLSMIYMTISALLLIVVLNVVLRVDVTRPVMVGVGSAYMLFILVRWFTAGRAMPARIVQKMAARRYAILSGATMVVVCCAILATGMYVLMSGFDPGLLYLGGLGMCALLIPLMVVELGSHVLDNVGGLLRPRHSMKVALHMDDEFGNSVAGAGKLIAMMVIVLIVSAVPVLNGVLFIQSLALLVVLIGFLSYVTWQVADNFSQRRSSVLAVPMIMGVVVLFATMLARLYSNEVLFLLAAMMVVFAVVVGALWDNAKKIAKIDGATKSVRNQLMRADLIGDVLKDVVGPVLLLIAIALI